MIYVVTGDGPRCGSSMMMLALGYGGIPVAYARMGDALAAEQARDGYHPNPTGRFELTRDHMWALGFPDKKTFEGAAIKVFSPPWGGLLRMVPGEYRICWMHRPPESRWQSFYKAHHTGDPPAFLTWADDKQQMFMDYRDGRAKETLEILKLRKDVLSVTELQFDEVIKRPLEAFWALKYEGWPIEPENAAKAVDPKLKRF